VTAQSEAMATLGFLRKAIILAKPYWLRLALGILCGVIAGLTAPMLMASIKVVVDVVFPRPDAPSLMEQAQKAHPVVRAVMDSMSRLFASGDGHPSDTLKILVILLMPMVMFLRGVFTYLNVYLMNWVAVRSVNDLRVRVFEHLMSLSASFFNRTSTGELMARFHEVYALQGTISQSLVVIVREPITVTGLAALLLSQQPKLTLITMIIFPLTILPFIFFRKKVRASAKGISHKQASLGKLLHETITGFRIVKAYNLEDRLVSDFKESSRSASSFSMKILRAAELPGPLIEFFGAVGVACFFIYIAFWAKQETPANLMQFIGSIFLMYQPIKSLIRLHNQLEQANAATQPVFDILNTRSTVVEPADPKPLRAVGADITFENVHFSYGEKKVVRKIDLAVPAGRMVALVGSSGAGKTTLTNLLLRFYDPQKGTIRIGGTDIREVSTRDLRSQIAVVTQETILFNDTIRANIALGRLNATPAEIEAAARHAYAHEFIMEKPQGYDTIIGERGVHLSGGQRQRIAIARAILKNAPILILDEATNALDTESERAVQAALEQLMAGRTTICIAHRLSTIQRADMIVVMSQGRIVEKDRHEALLQQGGHYQKLYELQFS
jgi:ATP-binding cassette, subfamily B, bacterial MsbA